MSPSQTEQDARAQFARALRDAGLIIDAPNDSRDHPIMDGQMHRVRVDGGKAASRDGAYVGFLEGKVPAGYIQNWKTGRRETWSLEGVPLTEAERKALAVQAQVSILRRQAETAVKHETTAKSLTGRWDKLPDADGKTVNPYLARKGVKAYGVRVDGRRLVVPIRDIDGKLWSLQQIPANPENKKMFAKGGRVAGNMHLIGEPRPGQPLLVGEGYATSATAHEASGLPIAVAFDSNNLAPVVAALKKRYPQSPVYVLGDDDHLVKNEHIENPGASKAIEAARKHGVGVGFPVFQDQGKDTDYNDLHKAEGLGAVSRQIAQLVSLSQAQTLQAAEQRFPEVAKALDEAEGPAADRQHGRGKGRAASGKDEPTQAQAAAAAVDAAAPGPAPATSDAPAAPAAPTREMATEPMTEVALKDAAVIGLTAPLALEPGVVTTVREPARPAPAPDTASSGDRLSAIEARASEGLAAFRNTVSPEAAQAWVQEDLQALQQMQAGRDREYAIHAMGYNAEQQVQYRIELQRQEPQLASDILSNSLEQSLALSRTLLADPSWRQDSITEMEERHAEARRPHDPATATVLQENVARQDLLTLVSLAATTGDGVDQMVKTAMQDPTYRASMVRELDRLEQDPPHVADKIRLAALATTQDQERSPVTVQQRVSDDVELYVGLRSEWARREASLIIGHNALSTDYGQELERNYQPLAQTITDDRVQELIRQRSLPPGPERVEADFEAAMLESRHRQSAANGLDKVPALEVRQMAREDVIALHALQDHPAGALSRDLVSSALAHDEYAQEFARQQRNVGLHLMEARPAVTRQPDPDEIQLGKIDTGYSAWTALAKNVVPADEAKVAASQDLAAYHALATESARADATLTIGWKAEYQREYRYALERSEPDLARTLLDDRTLSLPLAKGGALDTQEWTERFRERHVEAGQAGLDRLPASDLRNLARADMADLLDLRGGPVENTVKGLVLNAMEQDAYREQFERLQQRLGVRLVQGIAERTVDVDLPLATDAADALRKADVQRRASDVKDVHRDAMGSAAAHDLVALDLEALRQTTAPLDRLAIAVVIGANAATQKSYRLELATQDQQIHDAVTKAYADARTAEASQAGAQSVSLTPYALDASSLSARLNNDSDPLVRRGLFESEKPAGRVAMNTDNRPRETLTNSISTPSRDELFDDQNLLLLRRRIAAQAAAGGLADAHLQEVMGRMTEQEVKAYGQARSPEEAERVLMATQRRVEAEASFRPGRPSIPPLEDRFTIVENFLGRREYFARDQRGQLAFSEGWLSMRTESNSAAIIDGMLDRANERGWSFIRVNGAPEFERLAWIHAEARGIKAIGYEPTQGDWQAAAELRSRREQALAGQSTTAAQGGTVERTMGWTLSPSEKAQAVAPAAAEQANVPAAQQASGQKQATVSGESPELPQVPGRPTKTPVVEGTPETFASRAVRNALLDAGSAEQEADAIARSASVVLTGSRLRVGKVLEVGEARYPAALKPDAAAGTGTVPDRDAKPVPFVDLQTADGVARVWGVDLPRAFEAGKVSVGDTIAVEYRGHKPVTIDITERDATGKIVGTHPEVKLRNTWFAVRLQDMHDEASRIRTPDQASPHAGAVQAGEAAVNRAAASPQAATSRTVAQRQDTPTSAAQAAPTDALAANAPPAPAKQGESTPGLAAIYKAFEAALDSNKLSEEHRLQARKIFQEQMGMRQAAGERFAVNLYDVKAAPQVTTRGSTVKQDGTGQDQRQTAKRKGQHLTQ